MLRRMYKHFEVDQDSHGVYRVTLDVHGKPMNVLDRDVMTELEQIVTELEEHLDAKVIVFRSGKESGFLAGADVSVIEHIHSEGEADALIRFGQRLFDRIENLPATTVAVIHGPCLGGGLELALACDHRIARDNSSTKIGLPEIKLGLIPGWGGTQRLPRLVGLQSGIELILTGKHLSATDAAAIGLVDKAIRPDRWRDGVAEVISQLASARSLSGQKRRRFSRWLLESNPLGRQLVLSMARKSIASKRKHYPATESAVRAIADGIDPNADGYATERREFRSLIFSTTCRQLLRIFFAREQARSLSTWSPASVETLHRPSIRSLGVIGGGAMGAGIGQLAATRGYPAHFKEVDADGVKQAAKRIDRLVDQYASRKRLSKSERDELRGRMTIAENYDHWEGVDCVVEAVVERMDVKRRVLTAVENVVDRDTILATNTSSLSVTEMANGLGRPSQFAGLHFFNPVHRMELVEIVRGPQTSDATIARLVSFARSLGKTPIVTKDSPGFLVNRILFPYLGEAALMVREGYDVAEIEREVRRFGMPMGPLELLDRVGVDVALHVARSLSSVLPDVDEVLEVFERLVEQGCLGHKSGAGFYRYRGKRKQVSRFIKSQYGCFAHTPARTYLPDGLTAIQRRLIYPMLIEAVRCSEESVVEFPWAIDLAMVLGTGFAPHRGGPLSLVDELGAKTVAFNQTRLRELHGRRFSVPEKLRQTARSGERFVSFHAGDAVSEDSHHPSKS